MENYIWEKFNNQNLEKLRSIYDLKKLVSSGEDEFEQQLILKDWIANTLPNGKPCEDYSDKSAIEILEDAGQGKEFWCTQFAVAFVQCATALGWYSRKLAVDFDHDKAQESRQHGIADIWSNQFQKWYVIDPQNNIHFEKNNTPLNALEIRQEYLNDGGIDLKGVKGIRSNSYSFKPDDSGFATPSNYYWFFISERNNFFEKPGFYNSKAYLWVDDYNKDKTWYKMEDGKSIPHPMYDWAFIKTSDENFCFPKMS